MKEKINNEIESYWRKYVDKIIEVFGYKNHLFDYSNVEAIINSNSITDKNKFITYLKEQIETLSNID